MHVLIDRKRIKTINIYIYIYIYIYKTDVYQHVNECTISVPTASPRRMYSIHLYVYCLNLMYQTSVL